MSSTISASSARVLANAQTAAGRYKHRFVHTEYLLLGLLQERNSAARILKTLGYDRERLRNACKLRCRNGIHTMQENLKMTPNAQHIMTLAGQQAKALGHSSIDSRHILLGALLEEEGIAGDVLRSEGLTADAVRAAIIREQEETDRQPSYQPAPAPVPKTFWKIWSRT